MKHDISLRAGATVAFLATLTVNALANILPINNLTTGAVSDIYPSLFTPAGITFSIWSVIYFLLIGFLVYSWSHRDNQHITSLLPLFILSCVLNMSWIVAWHYLFTGISVLIMLALLFTLIRIFQQTRLWTSAKAMELYLVKLPFTIYLAWISVATIANISALLVSWEWSGAPLSPEIWTVLMMFIAAVLAGVMYINFLTASFNVVVMWALLGIFLRWRGSEHIGITYTALGLIVMLFLLTIYGVFRKKSTT